MNRLHYMGFISVLTMFSMACGTAPTPLSKGIFSESESQAIEPLLSPIANSQSAHIRGLHVLDHMTAWASGASGTVLRMNDGRTWQVIQLEKYAHLDFRDIEAIDAMTAIAMAAGEEGRILKTNDGGQTWNEVFTDLSKGVFLDAIDFDGSLGYCIGDPLDGLPYILETKDRGDHWTRVTNSSLGAAITGEGSYAASGTTLTQVEGHVQAAFGGDSLSRMLYYGPAKQSWQSVEMPLRIGAGCGTFSMAFHQQGWGIAVGGCYLDSMSSQQNAAYTTTYGETWTSVEHQAPRGYRSCVALSNDGLLAIACGRSGVDVSLDQGHTWNALSDEGFYTCSLADSTGWLMGRNGKAAKLSW